MSKSVKQSRIKKSTIVTMVAAALMVVFIVASIVLGVNIPTTTRLTASDGGKISSLLASTDGEWYVSTQKSNVIRMNEKGETLETYDIKSLAEEANLGDVGYVRSINKTSRDAQEIYAFTSTNHLIQLREQDGEMKVSGATVLTGGINDMREKDGVLYVLNVKNENVQISKFDVNDLSAGALATGYLYKPTITNNVEFSYLKRLTIQSFEIVEERGKDYVHIVHADGVIRFTTDFKFNGWQDELEEKVLAKVDEKIAATEGWDEKSQTEQGSLRTQYTQEASTEIAQEYKEHGIVSYSARDGKISFELNTFLNSDAYLYSFTEKAFRGSGYDRENNQYYWLTQDRCIYVYPVDELPTVMDTLYLEQTVPGVTLAGTPKDSGTAFFYDDDMKVGYVIYKASNRLSRVDFKTGELTFTTKANDDIRTLIQNDNGEDCYYVYLNKNEAAAGEFVLRHIEVKNQEYHIALQAFMIVSIVLAVVSAIVTLLAVLCWFKPGFSEKFMDTMRLIKKHWAIYVVIAACFTLVGMFCYYPAIGSIALSFVDYTVDNESKIWNNFANYVEVFTSPRAALEFGNMFLFLACDIFTALLPPLVFAFFLTIMRNKKYSAVMRTLLFIPGVIPGIATTLIWKSGIYDYPNGVINMFIQLFQGNPFDFMHDKIGTRVSIIMMGFPFVGSYLIFYGAMMNVPDSYYEAAELDGITVIKRFVFIDVPLIFPQIKYVLIMTFIASVQNFGRTYMTDMNNIYDTYTPIHTMYKKIQTEGNYGLASAYATVLFVFLFAATVFNMYSQKRDKEES